MELRCNNDIYISGDVRTKSMICTYTTVLLTILVVVGHITRMYSDKGIFSALIERDGLMTYVTNFVYSFHMPSFIAVSGAVFCLCHNDLGKYNNYKKFIKRKILRLIVPYFCLLLVFVNPVLLYVGKLDGKPEQVLSENLMLRGDTCHLWFLPTLFGCLMIMYFCNGLIKKYPFYTFIIAIVAWGVSLKFPIYYFPVLSAVLYYMIFFYIGYSVVNNIDKLYFIKSTLFIIVGWLLIMVLCNYTNYLSIKFMLNIIGIFFSFGCGWKLSKLFKDNHMVRLLSRNSFGIYLFHPLIIYLIFFYMLELSIQIPSIIIVIALIILIVPCSICLTECIRFLKLNFIIGEEWNTRS